MYLHKLGICFYGAQYEKNMDWIDNSFVILFLGAPLEICSHACSGERMEEEEIQKFRFKFPISVWLQIRTCQCKLLREIWGQKGKRGHSSSEAATKD